MPVMEVVKKKKKTAKKRTSMKKLKKAPKKKASYWDKHIRSAMGVDSGVPLSRLPCIPRKETPFPSEKDQEIMIKSIREFREERGEEKRKLAERNNCSISKELVLLVGRLVKRIRLWFSG